MNGARITVNRAWAFRHPSGYTPDTRESGLYISPHGTIAMAQGQMAIRQSILLLLSTSPGERVMRPDYGCHLRRLVFLPNDATTAGLAMHYIRQSLEHWEPRVEVVRILTGEDVQGRAGGPHQAGSGLSQPQENFLNILIEYRVRATHLVDSVHFVFNLTGETY